MDNLTLYDKLREVPDTAKKTIGGGRLKGFTDINSMWRIKALTEAFGPCGEGWYIELKDRWSEAYADEVAVFVEVALYYKTDNGLWSAPVVGTGGNKVLKKEKGDAYVSDEAYKMAETDAIGSACKKLGMGADVYWNEDRTKYSVEKDEEPKKETPVEKKQIDVVKMRALKTKCKNEGVDTALLCKIYNVGGLGELTENQYSNIVQHWEKVKETCPQAE